jgi:hypothetical protein
LSTCLLVRTEEEKDAEQQIKETLKLMGLDLLVNEFLKKAEPIEFNQNK